MQLNHARSQRQYLWLCGKNGAGKTTLIRLICGLQMPSSGTFTLYGIQNNSRNIVEVRELILKLKREQMGGRINADFKNERLFIIVQF